MADFPWDDRLEHGPSEATPNWREIFPAGAPSVELLGRERQPEMPASKDEMNGP